MQALQLPRTVSAVSLDSLDTTGSRDSLDSSQGSEASQASVNSQTSVRGFWYPRRFPEAGELDGIAELEEVMEMDLRDQDQERDFMMRLGFVEREEA